MIVIWIAAIVVFGIVEAVTVGLVSIWFVLGAVAGLLAAVLGAALWVQIVLFFVVSIAALAATRPLVQKMLHRDETPTNADRVLGQTARVTETIDPTKLETELGWKPKYNFDTGIQQTIQWYLDNEDWWKHILSGEYSNYFDNMYGDRLGKDLK